MKILDRYICRQLFVPFLIGVITFAVIMLGDAARQLGTLVLGLRAPLPLIAKYLLYYAPHAIVWAMPVGTVVAVAMALTSLKSHGEIEAMRASGASIVRVCTPILVLGFIISFVALGINEYVVPAASKRASAAFTEMTRTQPIVREQYDVYFKDDEGRLFYVGHMDAESNQLQNVVIWSEDTEGNVTDITAATWAELDHNVWILREGNTVRLTANAESIESVEKFGKKAIKLTKALQDYYTVRQRDMEMSGAQLGDLIRTVGPAGTNTHKLQVKWHFKYSIPLACFVFALIAAPVSLRFAHHGTFVGVVVAILVVFLYNGVRSWTLAFGLAGSLHPMLAGWTQNVLFALIGLIMLLRSK
jgi:lipopolysaccharide export system permease protein